MIPRHAPTPLLVPLLLGVSFAACDRTTATDPQLSQSASLAELPISDGMVPYREHMSGAPAADALLVGCEPVAAGVALPDRLITVGVATHLGRVTGVVTGTWCALDASGVVSIEGSALRTTASGDVLEATWTGTIAGDVLTLDVTFTGGSGRFQNATGWAVGGGTIDPSGASEWTLTGRITSPQP